MRRWAFKLISIAKVSVVLVFGAFFFSRMSFALESNSQITWNFGEVSPGVEVSSRIENSVIDSDSVSESLSSRSIASAGDVNGDGIDDLIVGYPYGNPLVRANGHAVIIFGSAGDLPGVMSSDQLDGTNGVVLQGHRFGETTGYVVKGVGDMNGDGFDDVGIGTTGGDQYSDNDGGIYIVYGQSSFPSGEFELSELDGANGFYIVIAPTPRYEGGILSEFSPAGDFNGDGISDLIIGNQGGVHDNAIGGKAYLLYGSRNPQPAKLSVDTVNDEAGIVLHGGDGGLMWVGRYVRPAGDINADGYSDVVIGYIGTRSGQHWRTEAVVVYGRPDLSDTPRSLVTMADVLLPAGSSANAYGTRASGIGDLNRDGIDDLSVPFETGLGIVFGTNAGIEPNLSIDDLINRDGGLYIPGDQAESVLGSDPISHSLSEVLTPAADMDRDGTLDLVVGHGAYHSSFYYDSESYRSSIVLLNAPTWHGREISYKNLDGCRGVIIERNQRSYNALGFVDVTADGNVDYLRDRLSPELNGYAIDVFSDLESVFRASEPNLVSHYDFNGTIGDRSANCHHLTSAGVRGNHHAVSREMKSILLKPTVGVGAPPRLSIGYRPALAIRGDITLRANIRPQSEGYAPIVTRYTSRTVNRRKLPAYSLQTMPGQRVRFSWLRAGSGKVEHCTTRANVLKLRRFNDVTATRDADTGLVRIWIDGRPVRVCRAPVGKLNSTRMALYVGAFKAGLPASTALIRLDDVKLYSRVLRADQIRQ